MLFFLINYGEKDKAESVEEVAKRCQHPEYKEQNIKLNHGTKFLNYIKVIH